MPRSPHNKNNPEPATHRASGPTEHRINEALIARWTRRLGIFTAILVGVTAASVVVAGLSAYFLYTTDQSIHKTLILGQRAFVHLDSIRFAAVDNWVSHTESNERLTITNVPQKIGRVFRTTFVLTNSGNTPTKNLRMVLDCQPGETFGEERGDPFVFFKWNDKNAIRTSIGAKQTILVDTIKACDFGQNRLFDAQMHIAPIFLVGEIDYEDWVEEDSPTHKTQFSRLLIINSLGGEDLNDASVSSTARGSHNCTDQDCPK